jgi:hypothetical protein
VLQIRQVQLDAFRRNLEKELVQRLSQQLREEFPEHLAEPAEARQQAELVLRKANDAGIESDTSVVDLARLMMRFGNDLEGFPDPAWAGAILSHKALPGDVKIRFLHQRLEPPEPNEDETEEA